MEPVVIQDVGEAVVGPDGVLYRRGRRHPAAVPPLWVSRRILSPLEMDKGFTERFSRYLEDPDYEDQVYEIKAVQIGDGWKHYPSGWVYQPRPIVPLRQFRSSTSYSSHESHMQAIEHALKRMGRTSFGGRVRVANEEGEIWLDEVLPGEIPRQAPIEVELWPWQNAATEVRVRFQALGSLPEDTAEQLRALTERGYRFQGRLLYQEGEFLLEFCRQR